ncbi:MAG: DNA/RNA helicase domain-containing protein [Terracidiphilus sp.]
MICFLTGVPGSGKTLVGLGLAHSHQNQQNAIHFMSGNGPLVKVLQHLFTQESRHKGANAANARIEARTLIENVHVFARYHMEDNLKTPSNHAVIFDEAQRAWNREQNKKKFNRDYSEPEMLLGIMERHQDWAAVIALVGGGQEIHDGEAGLEEWGRSLAERPKQWLIHASPEVLDGGASTAGHRLFADSNHREDVIADSILHLRTSNRSIRAEKLATWVNLVLDGDSVGAAALKVTDRFPIFLSRQLDQTRAMLREQAIGGARYGLVGSSGASRLRAEGLEPSSTFHAEYPWEHWYLAGEADIRSSFRCEVFATEFEIQGLELDWIGICWGGDCVWSLNRGWQWRKILSGPNNRWVSIKNPERRAFRQNAYRVLLTRARQGMVIFVPPGDPADATNSPDDFDSTSGFLVQCGVTPL